MLNNAKNAMKHSENTTYTCLEAFEKCFKNIALGSKIRFSAKMSNNVSIFKCKNNIIVSVRRLVDKIVCRRSVG